MKHVRLLLVASVCAVLPLTVSPAMAAPTHPAAPVGWHPSLNPPAGAVVQREVITLPAGLCASFNGGGAQASCQAIHYSYGVNHQALPANTTVANASPNVALAAAYWYWSRWDKTCSIWGCWYVSFTETEDGDANGLNVWRWSSSCSGGGLGVITWCGYFYNGGGYPYYAMQFGLNGEACIPLSGGTVCANHGIRRWIDDNGNPGGYSTW
jgi:hypothetical protein